MTTTTHPGLTPTDSGEAQAPTVPRLADNATRVQVADYLDALAVADTYVLAGMPRGEHLATAYAGASGHLRGSMGVAADALRWQEHLVARTAEFDTRKATDRAWTEDPAEVLALLAWASGQHLLSPYEITEYLSRCTPTGLTLTNAYDDTALYEFARWASAHARRCTSPRFAWHDRATGICDGCDTLYRLGADECERCGCGGEDDGCPHCEDTGWVRLGVPPVASRLAGAL